MKTIIALIFGGIALIIISIIFFIKFKSSKEIKKQIAPLPIFFLGLSMMLSSFYFQFKAATTFTKPEKRSITIKLDSSGLGIDTTGLSINTTTDLIIRN